MSILNIIAGPLIGALIGYGTNYVAVKMLFYPRNPVKIGNHTLPLTPGIIPKRKGKLAKALGEAVGKNLFTSEDLEQVFLSEEIQNQVVDGIINEIFSSNDSTIKSALLRILDDERYNTLKEKAEELLCTKIMDGISKIDIGAIITEKGGAAIKEMVKGSMFAMFVNDKLIASLTGSVGIQLETHIVKNGREFVKPLIADEINKLSDKPLETAMEGIGIEKQQIRNMIANVYGEFIRTKIKDIMPKFHINEIVEDKVNGMDILDIENLVLSVMKKELDSIINLGAPIGFIIGIFNIFL